MILKEKKRVYATIKFVYQLIAQILYFIEWFIFSPVRLFSYFENIFHKRRILSDFRDYCTALNRDDVTVVIGVRNRFDYRLVNSLQSIRNQDYPQELIRIVLVDYDSEQTYIKCYAEVSSRFNVDYIHVDNKAIWNRAEALNIGIKNVKTKFVLTSDIDIIFQRNYIRTGVCELSQNFFQIILANVLDTKEGDITDVINIDARFCEIKKVAVCRASQDSKELWGTGINMGITFFYQQIGGYDQRYLLWGGEDDDLMKRFNMLGLKLTNISNKSSFLHQWHRQYEGVDANLRKLDKCMKRNRGRLRRSYRIKVTNNDL